MADKTKIEWTDATWNAVTGCVEVSPGCDHCYAKTFAERWRGTPGHYFENGFDVQLRPERMGQPLAWTKPRKIFVNSMSDLFHERVPDSFIAEVFVTMARAKQHTFQLLTKRHGRARSLLNRASFRDNLLAMAPGSVWPLPNLHLGVSVENQQWADLRIDSLKRTPAAVRWLSMEPLLGPVNLDGHLTRPAWGDAYPDPTSRAGLLVQDLTVLRAIDWVVVGGESGPGARPLMESWVESIVEQCQDAKVPAFVKQMGAVWGRLNRSDAKGGDWDAWPAHLRVREYPAV